MNHAINIANSASMKNEVPVGSIIVKDGKIISSSYNLTLTSCDPSAHTEIVTIRKAAKKLNISRLVDCDMYVTLEPCPMCAQAISFARIRRLYFGAYDVKGGGVFNGARIFDQKSCFHKPEIYPGIMEYECKQLLENFFKAKRF